MMFRMLEVLSKVSDTREDEVCLSFASESWESWLHPFCGGTWPMVDKKCLKVV
jgi:hypothetical protein